VACSRRSSTGREGRYHLQAYRDAALGLGLTADQSQHFGFSVTSVPAELAGKYAQTTAELEAARQDYQPPVPVASAARGQRSNRNGVALKCQCSPPKTIAWLSPTWNTSPPGARSAGSRSRRNLTGRCGLASPGADGTLAVMSAWQYAQLTIRVESTAKQGTRTILWHEPGQGVGANFSDSDQTVTGHDLDRGRTLVRICAECLTLCREIHSEQLA